MIPVKGKSYITQGYGKTPFSQSPTGLKAYKNFPGGIHPGIDFGTSGINLPAISTIAGKVVRASLDGGWGNHVEVEGQDGWRRQYAHLDSISVKVGDMVVEGQELGRVGNTGSSTATHLHFGHRKSKLVGWEYRDPSVDWLPTQEKAPKAIKRRLIKSKTSPGVFVYNDKERWSIPTWPTKLFLFGEEAIEEVGEDVISKIPLVGTLPTIE